MGPDPSTRPRRRTLHLTPYGLPTTEPAPHSTSAPSSNAAPRELEPPPGVGGGQALQASPAGRDPVVAEREGFEPSVPVKVHALSKRAHSATLSPLRPGSQDARSSRGMAEREGFEPSKGLPPYWFSKPAHSASLAPLHPSCTARRAPRALAFTPQHRPRMQTHPASDARRARAWRGRSPARARAPRRHTPPRRRWHGGSSVDR